MMVVLDHMKVIEAKGRHTAEDNFDAVKFWSICESIVLCLAACFQVRQSLDLNPFHGALKSF